MKTDTCARAFQNCIVSPATDLTQLLIDWHKGDSKAFHELAPLVYGELRRLARSQLRKQRSAHTLQTTALVNEAYLRLIEQSRVPWRDRGHFFGFAAHLMRCILIDYARARGTAKRGGVMLRVPLDEALDVPVRMRELDLVDLDAALEHLAAVDARQARIVEMRFFAGMTVEEVSEVLCVSVTTVHRSWRSAKAFLLQHLEQETSR